ncbi:MAG: class I SAM-dependent methyltransferase [Chloroflexi bacterium]|nr:class I SAM-dependent methyltransferase [Chloroflexota bacterium]
MDGSESPDTPLAVDVETIRLQAEEHPLIEDTPPATPAEHCLRLVHLRAYDEAVARAAGRDVLDVGCNTGYGTVRFVPVARRVVGVDVSPGAIDAARLRAADGRPEFVLTSGAALPFADDSFDLVTSFQVLEHVSDPLAYLRELARVVRPGGELFLATPNAAIRLDPGMTPWNRFHVHEYLASELRELLRQVFPEVRVRGLFGTPTLYETEIRRVDAARQRIRRKQEAARRAEARETEARAKAVRRAGGERIRPARPLPIRFARRLLPAPVRGWLRSLVARATGVAPRLNGTAATPPPAPPVVQPQAVERPPEMTLDQFLEFSVADLFYADTDLDRAMDLLAVCRVGVAAGTA